MEDTIVINGEEYRKVKPEAKPKTKLQEIEDYIENNPLKVPSDATIVLEAKKIKIPLPNCNDKWTFEVWDWVRKFVEKFPDAYPTHYHDDDTSNFQYVNISCYIKS